MEYLGYQTFGVDLRSGVARVTFDHGEVNLMDLAMLSDLDRLGRQLEQDEGVRVVVFQSANPRFFIAHADVRLILALPAEPPPREEALGWVHATLDRFRTLPQATIAKIQGRCRGGGSELALACDMRFAEIGRAVLGQPEVGVGIIPGAGGSVRLPRLVGRGRALEIILGCGDYPAELAERYGYVNRALSAGEIDAYVDALAARIAGFPAEAIAAAKAAAGIGDGSLATELAVEERMFLRTAQTAAARRRMSAALAAGLQTPEVETADLERLWDGLVDE
ncbi:MAG: enoyl-CoA hydratase/isomerase family protein [Steroidobacteraceae bacterium]